MYQQQMGFPQQGPPMQPGQPGFMQYPGVQQFPQQQPGQQFVRMPNGQIMIMSPQYVSTCVFVFNPVWSMAAVLL
jgi:hypothetical protein